MKYIFIFTSLCTMLLTSCALLPKEPLPVYQWCINKELPRSIKNLPKRGFTTYFVINQEVIASLSSSGITNFKSHTDCTVYTLDVLKEELLEEEEENPKKKI